MSGSNCCFLTCIQVSQEAGKMIGCAHLLKNFQQFVVIHTVKGFSIVIEAQIDVFLDFPYFLYDPTNASNLISGSSAFSKPSLYIWKFSFLTMLKPRVLPIMVVACEREDLCSSLKILWHCLSLGLDLFQCYVHREWGKILNSC